MNDRRKLLWVIIVFILTLIGFGTWVDIRSTKQITPADYKPAMMAGGEIYWLRPSGNVEIIPEDCHVIGKIKKISPQTSKPDEDYESIGFNKNFIGVDICQSLDKNKIYVNNQGLSLYVPFEIIP